MASITKEDFDNFVASFADDATTGTLRNGFALYLMKKNSNNVNLSASELDLRFQSSDSNYISNKKAVSINLRNLITKVSIYKKRLNKNWQHIQHLLRKPAIVPQKRKRPSTAVDSLPGTSQQDKELSPPRAKTLRFDCDKCLSTKEEWSSKCQTLECKLKEKTVIIQTIAKVYKVKYVNKQKKRLFQRIAKLKNENYNLKCEISDLKKSMSWN